MASYILPGSSVIEFGCGRQVLRNMLPKDCSYQGSDIVGRDDNTLVLDLNGKLPELSRFDFVVLGGVLEYVENINRTLKWMSRFTSNIVFSYAVSNSISSIAMRREKGWISDWSSSDFEDSLKEVNFQKDGEANWKDQGVFHYSLGLRTETASQ